MSSDNSQGHPDLPQAGDPTGEELNQLQQALLQSSSAGPIPQDDPNLGSDSALDRAVASARAAALAKAAAAEPLLSGTTSGQADFAAGSHPDPSGAHGASSSSAVPKLADQFVSSTHDKGKGRAEHSPPPDRPSTPPPRKRLSPDDLLDSFRQLTPSSASRAWKLIRSGNKRPREPSHEGGPSHAQASAPSAAPLPQTSRPDRPSQSAADKRPRPDTQQAASGGGQGDVPQVKLPYIPGSTSVMSTIIPPAHVLKKLANSELVPLWHFTDEGMAAGYKRGMRIKELSSISGVLDSMTKAADPGLPKREDAQLSVTEFIAAFDTMLQAMDLVASTNLDPDDAATLAEERSIWQTQYNLIMTNTLLRTDPRAGLCWLSTLKKFGEPITPCQLGVGSTSGSSKMRSSKLQPIYSRFLATKSVQDIMASFQVQAAATNLLPPPAPAAPVYQSPTALEAFAPTPSAYGPGSSRHSGDHNPSAHGSSGRPQQHQQPFRQSTGSRPARVGACVVCGTKEQNHRYEVCSGGPGGKAPFVVRNERNFLGRASDRSPVCRFFNIPAGCNSSTGSSCHRGDHVCSLCGSTFHTAQSCGAAQRA
ncbi:hypothetical protein A4X09_0g5493 [Tilletia walkeri]|uniref:Uncharacterized protein n=1 Tax=Tilletia walkeri TaxID=117179 RepID=A0A8X7N725_9BASI|nr:hypothetical protein A4X09_0g5493 [Tilletia walkeri]